jgi:hypothetical protein
MTEFGESIIGPYPIPNIKEKTLGAVHEAARVVFVSPESIMREKLAVDSEVAVVAQRYGRKTGIFHRTGHYDVFTETMRQGKDFGFVKGRLLIEDGKFENAETAALEGLKEVRNQQNRRKE